MNLPTEKNTVRQIRKYIREAVREANFRIYTYRETGNVEPLVDRRVEYLRKMGGKGKKGELGVTLRGATKGELLQYARALESFKQFDIYSPAAIEIEKTRREKAFKTYKLRYGDSDLTEDEYVDLVTILGSMNDRILNALGSDQIKVLHDFSKSVGKKVKLLPLIKKVYRKYRKSGLSSERLTDLIMNEIRETE